MSKTVTAQLIALQASALQDLDVTDQRCQELAVEVADYNKRVREAADDLDFDQQPTDFQRNLRALSERNRP